MDTQQGGDADVGAAIHDYNNLHEQNVEHQSSSSGDGHHANASSTAAAALGIYPTMTIPQPTDLQFQAQSSEADANQDSFIDNSRQNSHQEDSYMENATGTSGRSGSKPAVGSDEWHKVRKDNHKEGMQTCTIFLTHSPTNALQLNGADARQSTRASTS